MNTPITPHPRRTTREGMKYIYEHVRYETTNLDPKKLNGVMDRLRCVDFIMAGITNTTLLPLFTETGEVPLHTGSLTEPKKPEWTVYEDSEANSGKATKPSWTIYCDNEVNNA